MQIIEAPAVQSMPYGLLSVASVGNDFRAAANGFSYQAGCGTGIAFTGGPCVDATVAVNGLDVTIDFGATLDFPATVNWGDGSEDEVVPAGETEASHTYAVAEEVTITVSGTGGSYSVTVDLAAPAPGSLTPATKAETGQITAINSAKFNVYALTECKAVGRDPSLNGAVDRLNASESHVLEQVLSSFAQGLDPAEDMSAALAFIQDVWFTATHGVRPIIHINAALLHYLRNVERHGNRLELKNGALVSAGTGYPTDAILISGEVAIHRGRMVTQEAFDTTSNVVTDFAERQYALAPGCEGVLSVAVPVPWETTP